jgi:hypothetical protein
LEEAELTKFFPIESLLVGFEVYEVRARKNVEPCQQEWFYGGRYS